jgi:hypothetical protein
MSEDLLDLGGLDRSLRPLIQVWLPNSDGLNRPSLIPIVGRLLNVGAFNLHVELVTTPSHRFDKEAVLVVIERPVNSLLLLARPHEPERETPRTLALSLMASSAFNDAFRAWRKEIRSLAATAA